MPYLHRDNGLRRAEETRERILDAALFCFSRHGYDGASMKQLAECCSLTDAALYYHFPSKQELLDSLLNERWRGIVVPAASPGRPFSAQVLHAFVDRTLERWGDEADFIRLLAREASSSPLSREIYARAMAEWEAALSGLFDEGFPAEAAGAISRAVKHVLVGLLFTGIQERGDAFAALVAEPAYRDRVHAMVAAIAPVERFAPGPVPR